MIKKLVTLSRPVREVKPWILRYLKRDQSFEFEAKLFDVGSEFGIDNGRLSKLPIYKDQKPLMNYQRGWKERRPIQN